MRTGMGCGRSRQMASPSSDTSHRQLHAKHKNNQKELNEGKPKKNKKNQLMSGSDVTKTTDDRTEVDDNIANQKKNGETLKGTDTEQNGVKLTFKMAFKDPSQSHTTTFLAQAKISTSQIDFFKMLDEKIAKGNDYASRSNSVISGTVTVNDFHHI